MAKGKGPYVHPVDAKQMRQDQGRDFQGKPGTPVVAIGLARVDYVKDDPGGFGKVVYYTLLSGPLRGQQIYVGHAAPNVTAGQVVQAGQPVAVLQQHSGGNAASLPGWTEIGFAKNGTPDGAASNRFNKFLKTLGTGEPYTGSVAAPVADTGSQAVDTTGTQQTSPDLSASYAVQSVQPPDPSTTQPLQLEPGSGPVDDVPQLWQTIASQSNVSADTQQYAANAQIATGA